MPRFDGTGPMGAGPTTGRGRGCCAGGMGTRGRGRGCGMRVEQPVYANKKEMIQDEKKFLEQRLKALDDELKKEE